MDNEQWCQWLKFGDIKGETESTIAGAQVQAISTNSFKIKFWGKEVTVNAGYVNNMNRLLTT